MTGNGRVFLACFLWHAVCGQSRVNRSPPCSNRDDLIEISLLYNQILLENYFGCRWSKNDAVGLAYIHNHGLYGLTLVGGKTYVYDIIDTLTYWHILDWERFRIYFFLIYLSRRKSQFVEFCQFFVPDAISKSHSCPRLVVPILCKPWR